MGLRHLLTSEGRRGLLHRGAQFCLDVKFWVLTTSLAIFVCLFPPQPPHQSGEQLAEQVSKVPCPCAGECLNILCCGAAFQLQSVLLPELPGRFTHTHRITEQLGMERTSKVT